MSKSSDPTISQPLQSSTEFANMLTTAHPTNANEYFLENDTSMNSNGPECEEDVVLITDSDVSIFSQWSFNAKNSHLPSSDPPHSIYLPPVSSSSIPFTPTPTLMPSFSLVFSFLNKLNNPSNFGIPATHSNFESLQRSSLFSLSDYASAMSIYIRTSTLLTQSMAQVVQPMSMTNHVSMLGLVPGSNHHVSGFRSLSILTLNILQVGGLH